MNNVENISYMLCGCSSLESLSDISLWNIVHKIEIAGIFKECSSLISLPNISKWKIPNIKDISCIFSLCSSLISLPDISKWVTNQVTTMKEIFYGCSSLMFLPNISKWNTENVTDMSKMFCNCSSLTFLPNISKWNIKKVENISNIFYGCSSLVSLPDISIWNTNCIINMSGIFFRCSSIEKLPDISIWNTENVKDMNSMFSFCQLLISLPDISKWNIKSVTDINNMFSNCSSLRKLPDISKWKTKKVKNITKMFYRCSSLTSVPDLSKWRTDNLIYMVDIFDECLLLKKQPKINLKIKKKDIDYKVQYPANKKYNTEDIIKVGKSVCKISSKNIIASGFFIKLFKDGKVIHCLMTNGHVIKRYMVKFKEIIDVLYNYDKKSIRIKLDEKERFIECEFELNTTIIEIKTEDNIKEKYFLLPNENYIDEKYIWKDIYILHYPQGKYLNILNGKITTIDKNRFSYNIDTNYDSSGSPIFLEDTRELIGMHKGRILPKDKYQGILINTFINLSSIENKRKYTKIYGLF